uniref:hypothetical protein n=1 Tax=Jatropha curcas TaxID=180498 RepID=UPI0027A56534|nr:hypothetical protein QLP06_mgp114 [Jatropha curcas]WFG81125.1 hypothetical protein [Jatropha curcas]
MELSSFRLEKDSCFFSNLSGSKRCACWLMTWEPLGFRGIGFSPMFALLKPTFSLPLRPPLLARVLPSKAERSPTDAFLHPTASADRLAPFIFGARAAAARNEKGGGLARVVSVAENIPMICGFIRRDSYISEESSNRPWRTEPIRRGRSMTCPGSL